MDEYIPEDERVRRYTRAVRTVNRNLRRKTQRLQDHADQLFRELCATDPGAEQAMGALWASGKFDCGPRDYPRIVEQCLRALDAVDSAGRIPPTPQSGPA